jgi:HEAT repeat protein
MTIRWYLDEIARSAGMVPIALRLAQKGTTADRLIAVTMLGLLKEESAAELVKNLAGSPFPVLSIAAAHASVQIEPHEARRFLTLRLERNDWPPAKVDAIIEQERAIFAPVLVDAIFTLPNGMHLVRYLRFCDADDALPAINRILDADSSDDSTIRSALKVLGQLAPRDGAERAAKFLKHENWEIRVQASNALGRIGDSTQVSALEELLGDAEWWVRYRAAQAIADLTEDPGILTFIHDAQSDRYARDVLTQVIAERSYEQLAVAS